MNSIDLQKRLKEPWKYIKPYQYSQVNPLRFSKEEYLRRLNWSCPDHRHTGLSTGHIACYNRYWGIEERKGFVDIEASNLDANFGIILSWCIKAVGKNEIYYDCLTSKDLRDGTMDKRIVETLIDHLWRWDRVIGHYSSKFDFPFIRTRALIHNIPFPEYGYIWHTDVWKMARNKLRLSSNRQGSVARAIQGKDIKTSIHPDKWLQVQFGNAQQRKKALDYVLKHNEFDVIQGEKNYLLLLPFIRETKTSL